MTQMFVIIDVIVAVVTLGIMAIVVVRWMKKRKATVTVTTESSEDKKQE